MFPTMPIVSLKTLIRDACLKHGGVVIAESASNTPHPFDLFRAFDPFLRIQHRKEGYAIRERHERGDRMAEEEMAMMLEDAIECIDQDWSPEGFKFRVAESDEACYGFFPIVPDPS